MKKNSSNQYIALLATVLFHTLLIVGLYFCAFASVTPETEEGVLVQFGYVDAASGTFEPMNTPQPTPQPAVTPTTATPESNQELLSQDLEDSIDLEEQKKQEEQQRREEEEERKAEEARNKVAGAFGSSAQQANLGDAEQGEGKQGAITGNSDSGNLQGDGGYGDYDMGGRDIEGALPRPQSISTNDYGAIVVSITVNPEGKVISARAILKGSDGTAYNNLELRKAAEQAASLANFKRIDGVSNQSGTITYRFKQR